MKQHYFHLYTGAYAHKHMHMHIYTHAWIHTQTHTQTHLFTNHIYTSTCVHTYTVHYNLLAISNKLTCIFNSLLAFFFSNMLLQLKLVIKTNVYCDIASTLSDNQQTFGISCLKQLKSNYSYVKCFIIYNYPFFLYFYPKESVL